MNLNIIVRNLLFIDIHKYLSFRWMGAPLKLDGAVSVCGMSTSVLLRHPNITSHPDFDARNYWMRGTTLSATATTVTIKRWKIMINKFCWKRKTEMFADGEKMWNNLEGFWVKCDDNETVFEECLGIKLEWFEVGSIEMNFEKF